MQDYPRDRFPALLARLEPRPWHTAARFLLRSGGGRVAVDDLARPRAAAVMMPATSQTGGAYLLSLGNPEALLDFLAEELDISRLWVSDDETERLINGTLFGDERTDITIHAATEEWRLPPLERERAETRPLGPPDAEAVTRLLRGEVNG